MKHIIKTDFYRAFISLRFPAAIFMMYLVWELNSQRFVEPQDVLYLFIHTWGRSTTFLLAMVVSAVVYTTSFCDEIEHHFLRYEILRTGVHRYVFSKILTSFVSGFLTVFLGTILFIGIKNLSLPLTAYESLAVENFQPISCFGGLLANHTWLFILLQTALSGMSCGAMSVLALAFSTFMKKAYGVYAIPFLLHYCFFYLFGKLALGHPIFNIEKIFDCVSTYTNQPVFFLLYGLFVVSILVLTGYWIMYKRIKGVFQ